MVAFLARRRMHPLDIGASRLPIIETLARRTCALDRRPSLRFFHLTAAEISARKRSPMPLLCQRIAAAPPRLSTRDEPEVAASVDDELDGNGHQDETHQAH